MQPPAVASELRCRHAPSKLKPFASTCGTVACCDDNDDTFTSAVISMRIRIAQGKQSRLQGPYCLLITLLQVATY